eukprot:TRINITY_DN108988_c0_g1_i1.p1 TRINITY_DN108988_c0_g1~~TRINITY_DN108988_c0_g1_i1.p1  ORF type:complete len:849 (+),score=195.98 TRINITY_DN108988_c0_g1_i1:84-2549(+)
MAAGLTAADPFSAPSLLVLKDQKDYVQKLERSFASRRWCDHGTFSEPIMMHSLFVEWIRAGAPRGVKAIGSFAREWSIIPKKFESLVADAMDLTVRVMKLLKPKSDARLQIQELLSAMHVRMDDHEDLVRVSGYGKPEKIFISDTDRLRALVGMAFSDQMMLHTSPKWVAQHGSKKKRQEEQLLDLMYRHEFEPINSVGIFAPQGVDEDDMKQLCKIMSGEEPEHIHHEEKSKMMLVSFKPSTSKEALDHEEVLLWDVPASIHRLHMFGSGRYRFFVDRGHDEEAVELFKPLQPFALSWEVLTHPGKGSNKAGKKAPTLRGMCDWRNPLGFACHCDDSTPPTEFVGCAASVQGLEGGAQAFVSGATALPLRFLPFLLVTLCPERWQLQWGVDAGSGEVKGVKILHYELVNLPPKTFAPYVLESINELRAHIREALYPPSWLEEEWDENWQDERKDDNRPKKKDGRGRSSEVDSWDPPDLGWLLTELLEVCPEAGTSGSRPSKIKWRLANSCSDDWGSEEALRPMQALCDPEDAQYHQTSSSKNSSDANDFSALQDYLRTRGEVGVHDLPAKLWKNAKQLKKRKDLFAVRTTKNGSHMVRLVGGKSSASKGGSATAGISDDRQKRLADVLIKILTSKGTAVGLGELGSKDAVQQGLSQQSSSLQKIRPFLSAFPKIFKMGIDATGQVAVHLVGTNGGAGLTAHNPGKHSGKGSGRSEKGGREGVGKGKGGKGMPNTGALAAHIAEICRESPAQKEDFDSRVRSFLVEVQESQGLDALDDAFDTLHEWLGKKEDRDEIKNWPGYMMKLLNNWRIDFEEEMKNA